MPLLPELGIEDSCGKAPCVAALVGSDRRRMRFGFEISISEESREEDGNGMVARGGVSGEGKTGGSPAATLGLCLIACLPFLSL
jgi:hypothetical protein